jgi:hypothetical protein
MKSHTSVVQKLIIRSVTGRRLGLKVQAHTGWTIHVSWNPGVDKGSYKIALLGIPYSQVYGMRLHAN